MRFWILIVFALSVLMTPAFATVYISNPNMRFHTTDGAIINFTDSITLNAVQWGGKYLNVTVNNSNVSYSGSNINLSISRLIYKSSPENLSFNAVAPSGVMNVQAQMSNAASPYKVTRHGVTIEANDTDATSKISFGNSAWSSHVFSVLPLTGLAIITYPATNLDMDSATFTAKYVNVPSGGIDVWFDFGRNPDHYKYTTDKAPKTTNGTYSVIFDGFPLMAKKQFYYRGAATDAVGNQSSFTLSAVSPINDYNFDRNFDELKNANFNISKIATVLPRTWDDIMGTMFWGIFFGMVFIAMWIRQGDVTIPALVGIIISVGIFSLVPQDYLKVGYALLIVSIGGIIYSIIFKK